MLKLEYSSALIAVLVWGDIEIFMFQQFSNKFGCSFHCCKMSKQMTILLYFCSRVEFFSTIFAHTFFIFKYHITFFDLLLYQYLLYLQSFLGHFERIFMFSSVLDMFINIYCFLLLTKPFRLLKNLGMYHGYLAIYHSQQFKTFHERFS